MKCMSLYKISLYFLMISTSLGVFYNLFSIWGVLAFLFMAVMLDNNKKINGKVITCTVLFAMFIVVKCWSLYDYQQYSVYFGIYKVIKNSLAICCLIIGISIIEEGLDLYTKCKMVQIFNFCYYVSLVISIAIMLIHGRNIYRYESDAGGILLAPQIFVYYSLLMSMFTCYMLCNGFKGRLKNGIYLVINIVYLVLSNYTTQILFMFLGLALIVFLSIFKKKKYRLLAIYGAFLFLCLIFPFLPNIINIINEALFIDNEIIYVRLKEIALLLSNANMEKSDFGVRLDYMGRSFNTFRNHFMIGVPFGEYNSTATGIIVGGHSQWPDDLGRFGLVGMFLWLLLLYRTLKNVFFPRGMYKEFCYLLMFVFGLYGFLNPFMSMPFLLIIYVGALMLQTQDLENE